MLAVCLFFCFIGGAVCVLFLVLPCCCWCSWVLCRAVFALVLADVCVFVVVGCNAVGLFFVLCLVVLRV